VEWEDAMLEGNDTESEEAEPEVGDINITFGGHDGDAKKTKRQVRRRAITSVDRRRRLDIHKMHILCLLYHVYRRNAWCNDVRVQARLRQVPSPKALSNLVPNPEYSQYQTSRRFTEGMNELKLMWSKRYNVTAKSMYKPRWQEPDAETRPSSDFDELDDPMDREDFLKAASKLEGSSDLGQQLFCALLRGIGVEARLVCSLQCLPFASAAQPSTPQKSGPQKNTIIVDPYKAQNPSPSGPRMVPSARLKRGSRLELALGERHPLLKATAPKQRKAYQTPYPVYWVEAFNSAHQKWIPIDPLSTFTVNAAEKMEPPLNSTQNSLVYAIAFDEEYTAKDVTRRYAKAYNAKTRKFRVDSTPNGDRWWERTMKFFQRSPKLARDETEDAALARKEGQEGIPKNVQDFKNHPIYVLERHLRYNEVIHPMDPVGKVNVGTAMNPKMESIYRRGNVHIVRSADKWYRMGRDVQGGEQPLRHAKPKKGRRMSLDPDMDLDDQGEEIGAGLYAEFQTELYVPPPVVRGRVPRNAYGNLDLYVPSMCPPGGAHIRHKLASKAARLIGVDYAEAVTGFSFKGRHGTAVVQGVVVAQEYADAVEAVIDGMEYEQEEAIIRGRSAEALRLWRRFCLGLRVVQRINAIEIDGETGPNLNVQEEIGKADKAVVEETFAGGFFPDEGDDAQPAARGYEPPVRDCEFDRTYRGGFNSDEDADMDDRDGGFVPERGDDAEALLRRESSNFGSAILSQQQLRPRRTDSGRFIPEDDENEDEDEDEDEDVDEDDDGGGGFLRRTSPATAGPSTKSSRKDSTASGVTVDRNAGGFVPEIDSADVSQDPIPAPSTPGAPTKQEDTPATTTKQETTESTPPNPEGPAMKPRPTVVVNANATSEAEKPKGPPALQSSNSTVSDAGSLPLEDPEDSDADPDWLVDAT
jgi:xeroderma pigmentosum group C-complementing protein